MKKITKTITNNSINTKTKFKPKHKPCPKSNKIRHTDLSNLDFSELLDLAYAKLNDKK
jgi:hypothetical protein